MACSKRLGPARRSASERSVARRNVMTSTVQNELAAQLGTFLSNASSGALASGPCMTWSRYPQRIRPVDELLRPSKAPAIPTPLDIERGDRNIYSGDWMVGEYTGDQALGTGRFPAGRNTALRSRGFNSRAPPATRAATSRRTRQQRCADDRAISASISGGSRSTSANCGAFSRRVAVSARSPIAKLISQADTSDNG
jgi:hypothetical protein